MKPNKDLNIISYFFSSVVILLSTFLCYGGLIVRNLQGHLNYMIKWDLFDIGYPRLLFNSDSIANSVFPLWNPYIYGGVPYVAYPTSGLFYPINMLIILLTGYSLEILQFQLVATFFMGGVFMFCCLRHFNLSKAASLIGAITFLSCGFFVSNAEHFSHVNILAFLPLAFMATDKLLNKPNIYTLSLSAITIALITLCAYPTLLIMCMYLFTVFAIFKIYYLERATNISRPVRKIFFLFGSFAMGICISALFLVPAFEAVMFSTRGSGAPLESIKANSLPFRYLATMWYPFLALKDISPFQFEITLRNCSIGILGLFLAMYHLIFNKTRLKWSLTWLLAAAFMLALGTNTPIYIGLIKIIPFIKDIRHPALDFRVFIIFFLCMFAGFGAQDMLQEKGKAFKNSIITLLVFLCTAVLVLLSIKSIYNLDIIDIIMTSHRFFILSISLLLIVVVLAKINIPKQWLAAALIAFCVVDSSHWVKTNFFTVADLDNENRWANIKRMESERNLEARENTVFKRNEGSYPISIKDNFAPIFKKFSNTGYDPLLLKYYDNIMKSRASGIITEDFRILPVYMVRLLPNDDAILSEIANGANLHDIALINEKDIKNAKLLSDLKHVPAAQSNDFSATIVRYTPNTIYYKIKTSAPVVVFFNEIYYPGWKMVSKKRHYPLFRINHAFRGTYLEPGDYKLKMYFSPASFKAGLTISVLSLLFILSVLLRKIYTFFYRNKRPL